jgi:hypothetical protein
MLWPEPMMVAPSPSPKMRLSLCAFRLTRSSSVITEPEARWTSWCESSCSWMLALLYNRRVGLEAVALSAATQRTLRHISMASLAASRDHWVLNYPTLDLKGDSLAQRCSSQPVPWASSSAVRGHTAALCASSLQLVIISAQRGTAPTTVIKRSAVVLECADASRCGCAK